MNNREKPEIADEIAAALDWWRDAGVDCNYLDAPVDWLAPPVAAGSPVHVAPVDIPTPVREPRPAAHVAAAQPLDTSGWPTDLGAFADWWLAEPSLDAGRVVGRVAPRGPAGADLMVIVEQPEEADTDTLLSGREGKLLDTFLSAIGLSPERVYVASVLPRHMPLADWADIAARGFGPLLSHHVALVQPKRLIAFGGNILPLTGNDLPNKPAVLRTFNHEGTSIPLLGARALPMVFERPAWKAALWHGWLEGSP